ncbi:MAG: EpsG family protein [Fusobacteriaceae bacterium]
MNIYSLVFIGSYMISIFKVNKYFKQISLILLILFLTTSYTSGSDWRAYELMYKYFNLENFYNYHSEKGFSLYIALNKYIFNNFWYFFIINKLLVAYIFNLTIKKYYKNNLLVWSIFFPAAGVFLFIDCPFRNLLAIGIYLSATKYIKLNRMKYFCIILFGFFFHKSILIVGLISIMNFSKFKRKTLGIILIIELAMSFQINKIIEIFKFIPIYGRQISVYSNSNYFDGKVLTIGMIEKLIVAGILIFYKNKILKDKDQRLFNLTFVYLLCYILAVKIPILTRFVYYNQIFYLIFICYTLKDILKIKILYIFIFLYYLLITPKIISNSYMEYDTYLMYFFREVPYKIRMKINKPDYKEYQKEIFLKEGN